jgi:hypothetical protein
VDGPHWAHILVAAPRPSAPCTVWYPSSQVQLSSRVESAGDVLWAGQVFRTPVQHQVPGSHAAHGALATPAYPGAQWHASAPVLWTGEMAWSTHHSRGAAPPAQKALAGHWAHPPSRG